jgi:hypothetical protein
MIDKNMVMACVLARLQSQGIELEDVTPEHLQETIDEAIADLRFADEVVSAAFG